MALDGLAGLKTGFGKARGPLAMTTTATSLCEGVRE
jgi:hypothetical protein